MEIFKEFLESTTIHGLSYIASTKRFLRLFWILIVITGFSTAGFLIYESFQSWKESPITTTIKTLPIEEIRFPKVSVCPPKNTYTNLNYDIENYANTTLDTDTKEEILHYVLQTVNEADYQKYMEYFDIIQVENIFLNLYWQIDSFESSIMGQTYSNETDPYSKQSVSLITNAFSGKIQTKDFGKEYQTSFAKNLDFRMTLKFPDKKYSKNSFKMSVEQVTSNDFQLSINGTTGKTGKIAYNEFFGRKLMTEAKQVSISYQIQLNEDDLENLEIEEMLGFCISWNYTENLYDKTYVDTSGDYDILYVKNQTRRYIEYVLTVFLLIYNLEWLIWFLTLMLIIRSCGKKFIT